MDRDIRYNIDSLIDNRHLYDEPYFVIKSHHCKWSVYKSEFGERPVWIKCFNSELSANNYSDFLNEVMV